MLGVMGCLSLGLGRCSERTMYIALCSHLETCLCSVCLLDDYTKLISDLCGSVSRRMTVPILLRVT